MKTRFNSLTDITQQTVFKDIADYRIYDDMTLRAVAIDKLDSSEKTPRLKMPL